MTDIKTNLPLGIGSSPGMAFEKNSIEKAKSLANRDLTGKEGIEKAAGGFEALLLHDMLKAMWKTVEHTGFLGNDSNEAQIYRDMLNQSIADSIVEGKGIGIKEFLTGEIAKLEGASKEVEGEDKPTPDLSKTFYNPRFKSEDAP